MAESYGAASQDVQQQALQARACVWGAAEMLREGEGWGVWPPDQLEFARDVVHVRSMTEPVAFDAAWHAGCSLILQRASVAAAGQASVEAEPIDTLLVPV